MDPQLFCLRWNNHQANLLSVFDQLLQLEAFCDVTLAVDGASIKCHKMVLAACSSYFQNLFIENDTKHPIVFLKDISFTQTRALLDYMYHGEVSVEEEELPALLDFAKALKVKGLVKDDDKMMVSSSSVKKTNKSNCSNGSGPPAVGKVWTVSESKLTGVQPKETNGEEDQGAGTLVIDEESNDIPVEADLEISEDTPPGPGMVKTIGPNGKVEWKRYKQYTKDDILAAIEEVKNGMSALQASRKYGVPSRTLYDKVKKMGIMTANMQKQLQMKNKGTGSEASTPAKSNNFSPISLLGMQMPQSGLPQAQLPTLPNSEAKVNGDSQPFTSPFMLSMIEKIKAASLNKPGLGETPLNLSAMLDTNGTREITGSDNDSSRSGESSESGVDPVEVKQENGTPDQDNIRAQFFADLKRMNNDGDIGLDMSKISTLATNGKENSSSSHQVRSEEENLPPRKRKVDIITNGGEEGSDCKKVAHDDDLETSSIKLEATSC